MRVRVCARERKRELTMFVHTVPEVDEHIDPPYKNKPTGQNFHRKQFNRDPLKNRE